MSKYTVTAVSNYNTTEFANKRQAIAYARSIVDGTNSKAVVRDTARKDRYGEPTAIAGYAYTPNDGGKTYKINVD